MEESSPSNVRNRDDEGEGLGKRQKIEHKSPAAIATVVAVSDQKELTCGICFEGSTAENTVQCHQCSTCTADAWHVCGVCNSSLLSRACPFCKTDYAPMILYEVSGRHLSDVRSASIDGREKMILTIKIKFLESLIPAGNTLLWYPVCKDGRTADSTDENEEGTALFCLPKEFFAREKETLGLGQQSVTGNGSSASEVHGEGEGVDDCEVILVSLSMSKSELRLRAADGSIPEGDEQCCFHFLNETWNHLLSAAEGGSDDGTGVAGAIVEGVDGANMIVMPQTAVEAEVRHTTNTDGSARVTEAASRSALRRTAIEAEVTNATRAQSAAKVLRLAITNPRSRLFLPMAADQWEDLETTWKNNVIVGH
jgi:hypothetical protein